MTEPAAEIISEWVHLAYAETARIAEVYGFSGSQGMVNLEGVRFRPKTGPGVASKTLIVFMHPATTLQLLPVPRALAARGAHVLCAASRYSKNDSGLIMEKVALDLGCYMRHAREVWGYEHIVIDGWSGGGSLALFYQSQAEQPTITESPAGDPVDIPGAGLYPADGVIFHAGHQSRAMFIEQAIDPSVLDENAPDRRDHTLDIYDRANPNQPPYTPEFIARYRAAQIDRVQRRTAWVKDTLARIRDRPGEADRGFVVHRTMADLRFMDPAVDPNDRRPRWCYLGDPSLANTATAGLARYSSLRSWLSQWSPDDSNAIGPRNVATIKAPVAVIENTADDAAPASDCRAIFDAATTTDKTYIAIKGATHYYQGQPELLAECCDRTLGWMAARGWNI